MTEIHLLDEIAALKQEGKREKEGKHADNQIKVQKILLRYVSIFLRFF